MKVFSAARDIQRNLPRSIHAFGTNLILLPLGIVGSILIARSIGPAAKGYLDLIVATATLLITFLGLSLPSGVTYVVARGHADLRKLRRQLVVIALLQGVIAAGILTTLRALGYSSSFIPDSLGAWVIVGVALYVSVEMLSNHWRSILNGKLQNVKANNSELIGRTLYTGALFLIAAILFLLGKRLSITVLFVMMLGVTLLINGLLLKQLSPYWAVRPEETSTNNNPLKAVFSFAAPSYLGNLVQFLNYRLDVFIVGIYAGAASVGRYTLAVSLAQLLWMLSNATATVILPKIAGENSQKNIEHTARIARLSLWASLIAGAVFAAFATVALPALYGEAFRPSVQALYLLLPGIVLFSVVNVLAAYLAGIGSPKLNLYIALAALVVTVTLLLILVPTKGINGAAIASSASYSLSTVLTVAFFFRKTGCSIQSVVLPTMDDIRLLGSIFQPFLRHVRPQQAG